MMIEHRAAKTEMSSKLKLKGVI